MHFRRFLFLLFVALALSWMNPLVWAQGTKSGTITNAECVPIDVGSQSTVGIQVVGTWTGTLQPKISVQGQVPANIQVTPSTSSTAQSTITANGVFRATVAGGSSFLVCGNTVASGAATVYLNASQGVAVIIPPAAASGLSGMTAGQIPVAASASTVTSSKPIQGTDANLLSSGTVGGVGSTLCSDANGGATTLSCSPGTTSIITTGMLAQYLMNECSGTTITDSSGNANNGTFGAQAPTWYNGGLCTSTAPYSGVQFSSASSQFVTLPAALNASRTIFMVLQWTGPNSGFQAPLAGNAATASDWGVVLSGSTSLFTDTPVVSPNATTGGGIEGWAGGGPMIRTPQNTWGFFSILCYVLGSAGDSTHDQVWVNDTLAPFQADRPFLYTNSGFASSGQSASILSAMPSNLQFGGSASGKLFGASASFFTGTILYSSFYNIAMTQAQIGQTMQGITNLLGQRSQYLTHTLPPTTSANNSFVAAGDSITYGSGLTTTYPAYVVLNTPGPVWQWANIGMPSATAIQLNNTGYANQIDSYFVSSGGANVSVIWLGTNDCAGGGTGPNVWSNLQSMIRNAKHHYGQPYKTILVSMISRTLQDTCKNALNTPMRQYWQSSGADGFADVGEDVNLGADGDSANATYFQGDAIHPTTHAQANDIAPIVQHEINAMYGNNGWNTANLYTTTAVTPTATTAGSETSHTITLTFGATPANCVAGSRMIVTGVTPAGYNSAVNSTWTILTRTATQVTFWNNTTALGVITVQGTGQCPSQVDADVYTRLGGAATTPNFILETCQGKWRTYYFKNENTTSPWTLTPEFAAETIDGAASLAMPTATSGNLPVVALQPQIISAAAGGCTWQRVQ